MGRAGVTLFPKVGDIALDLAVRYEGDTGRMIQDDQYPIDMGYTYPLAGDILPYIDLSRFSPFYSYEILGITGDPIVHMDLQPHARKIAVNLSLPQSRAQAESSQGSYHIVVRLPCRL